MTKHELLKKITEYTGISNGFIRSPMIIGWLDTYVAGVAGGSFKSFSDYEDSKNVKFSELEQNFKQVDLIHGTFDMSSCPKCGSSLNSKRLPSESWSKVRYCWECKRIYYLAVQDRMSGVSGDILVTFEEKKE